MHILINTPFINSPAGVSNYYLGLRPYFSHKVFYNQYFTSNYLNRKVRLSFFIPPLRLLTFVYDLVKFIILIFYYRKPVVLLNPSFGGKALNRDAQFLKIAKFFSCKVGVFMRGWDKNYVEKVINGESKFSSVWLKADAFFVLAKEFREYLKKLGIKAPIHITSTKVNDKLLEDTPEKKRIEKIQNILFLARVEKVKGIFITIEAFNILRKKFPDLYLRVVGEGSMLKQVKDYLSSKNINNCIITGPLYEDDLKTEFSNADLYILPTTHGEGMPNSVLEAMAFGLPVITRPVGGLKDFFENGKMGYMVESLDPEDYAAIIEMLIKDINKANNISGYNKKYAKEHFMASKVAKDLEDLLKTM